MSSSDRKYASVLSTCSALKCQPAGRRKDALMGSSFFQE